MTDPGPLDLLRTVVEILDDLGVPYALGGSIASSFIGEPRSTVDVDVAIRLEAELVDDLLRRAGASFYLPEEAARRAIEAHESFNLLDTETAMKVDLFVVGDSLLDRMQIERRIPVQVPGFSTALWVTSPEDQVLRKLAWFRSGGSVSDRQWRDVVGILRVQAPTIDLAYLQRTALEVDLHRELAAALTEAGHVER
jgi:hypothetical protein